jgi:hypothetical protein
MEVVPGQPALSVLELFEGDRRWGIPFDSLQHEGPPVQSYAIQPNADGHYENALFAPVSDQTSSDQPVVPLTQFVFWQAHTYCNHTAGHAGHMAAGVQDVEQARSQLREQFSFHSQFGGTTYYETMNFSAWVLIPGSRGAAADVMVRPCRPMTEDQMPACVREWFRSGAPCNGYFGDLRYGYFRAQAV